MNRRKFIKLTGITLGGLVLAPKELLWPKDTPKTQTSISLDNKLSKGDVITIAGYNNPTTGSLQRFIITGDASSGTVYLNALIT